METMIEIRDLHKAFPGETVTRAVDGVSLCIEKGGFVTLLGPSGAGKSTLLRCLNGLTRADSGSVTVNGLAVADPGALRGIRQKTGMIFQNFGLVNRLSVLHNVLCGRLSYNGSLRSCLRIFPKRDVDIALSCLERVGLSDKRYNRADQLSGGQRQRVGIARALAQEPDVILADEPVSSLDPASSRNILEILRGVNERDGITILVSLHNVHLAREFGARVIGMRDGRVVYDGTAASLRPESLDLIYGDTDDERR